MPAWFEASVPVMLAALLAAIGALFLELREHRDRIISLEGKVDSLIALAWRQINASHP